MSPLGDENIRGLDVTVNDALAVRASEPLAISIAEVEHRIDCMGRLPIGASMSGHRGTPWR